MLSMLGDGATHVAVATDHVIESFRNELWRGHNTSEGIEPALFAQFHPLEDALRAMGLVVLPMVEFESDDGLAAVGVHARRPVCGSTVIPAGPLARMYVTCWPSGSCAAVG